jgi:hypothetical protein
VGELFIGWRFALRRMLAGWRLMAVAAVGVVVAATLLAASPIYANSMSDLGLRFRLDRGLDEPRERVAFVEVDGLRLNDGVDRARRDAIDAISEERVGWIAPELVTEERSARLDLSFVGFEEEEEALAGVPVEVPADSSEVVRQPWGTFVYVLSNLERDVDLVEGRFPDPTAANAEVVLPDGFQRHAAIGDQLLVTGRAYDDCQRIPRSQDPSIAAQEEQCQPSTLVSTKAVLTVVGFVAPKDPQALRWELFSGDWEAPSIPFQPRLDPGDGGIGDDGFNTSIALTGFGSMPLLTSDEQFFGPIAQRLPELTSRHRVGILPDIDTLPLTSVAAAIEDLSTWRDEIGDTLGLTVPARLIFLQELEKFRNAQTFNQIPLLLILLQVVGIVLYYVVLVMALLLERQTEEVGVYRSRGANTMQLVGFNLFEGLALAVPGAIIGPFLAAQAVRALGLTPTFDPITGGGALPVSIPPESFLLAIGGAALALFAILLPAFIVANRGIIDVKREAARPAGRNLVQRYYLDFAFVALAGLLLWQLDQRGSVFDPEAVGGWSSDPLLLLSPLVLTIAVAVLVLRFYPPLVRSGVRILLAFRGTAVALGLRRTGRSPGAYARLILLLVMATAIGTFAASYGPTVDQSFDERERYAAGVEARAELADDEDQDALEKLDAVRALDGVDDAALAYRGEIATAGGLTVPLLALDPAAAREDLFFRDDFSEETLAGLMGALEPTIEPGGLELPEDAVRIDLAMRGELLERHLIHARFRDANGRAFSVLFDRGESVNWTVRSEQLPAQRFVTPPLTLVGIEIGDRFGFNLRFPGTLFLDEVVVATSSGRRVVLDGFEEPLRWTLYPALGEEEEQFALTSFGPFEGESAGFLDRAPSGLTLRRVIAPRDPTVPLNAIMNAPAMAAFGVAEGDVTFGNFDGILVPMVARNAADFFPTLDPVRGFVVVNREHLQSVAAAVGFEDYQTPNELWLDFAPGTTMAQQQAVLDTLVDRDASPLLVRSGYAHLDARLEEIGGDPTLQASGSGILVVAFIAVLTLTALGFVVTLATSMQSRIIEFAVLRAVGSSSRQILRSMLLEWGTVLVLGSVIGVFLGRRVASIMLSFLDVTEQGDRVLPPFIVQTDWARLGLGVGLLVAIVFVGLALSWVSSMRAADARQLRITQ